MENYEILKVFIFPADINIFGAARKNEDDLKIEDGLKNKDLKNEDNIRKRCPEA